MFHICSTANRVNKEPAELFVRSYKINASIFARLDPIILDTLKAWFCLVLPQPHSLYCLEIKRDKLQHRRVE